jgi:hypothetical protein
MWGTLQADASGVVRGDVAAWPAGNYLLRGAQSDGLRVARVLQVQR